MSHRGTRVTRTYEHIQNIQWLRAIPLLAAPFSVFNFTFFPIPILLLSLFNHHHFPLARAVEEKKGTNTNTDRAFPIQPTQLAPVTQNDRSGLRESGARQALQLTQLVQGHPSPRLAPLPVFFHPRHLVRTLSISPAHSLIQFPLIFNFLIEFDSDRFCGSQCWCCSNRAFCYSQLELHKHVIKDCDRALELDPALLQAYILKGFSSIILSNLNYYLT